MFGSVLVALSVLVAAEVISRMDETPDGDADAAALADAPTTNRAAPQLMVIVPDSEGAAAERLAPQPATQNAHESPDETGDGGAASHAIDGEMSRSAATAPLSGPGAASGVDVQPDWELLARSVVQIYSRDCEQTGSGVIIGGAHVLTNSHVLHRDGDGPPCDVAVGTTERFDRPPQRWLRARIVASDEGADIAVVALAQGTSRLGSTDDVVDSPAFAPVPVLAEALSLGDELTILGYPGFGDSQTTLTFTTGRFSGVTDIAGRTMWKTDALLDAGVSGGAVFDSSGHLVGIAVGGVEGEGGTLGLIIPSSAILRFTDTHGISTVAAIAADEQAGSSSGDVVSAALPRVTFPEASVRDAEAEAADLARRRSVIGLFERLRVEAEHRRGYSRDAVFDGWLYRGGLSTRERVLRDEQRADGTWYSAYDASVVTDEAELDVDHLVPLAEAWESGGHLWTEATWTRFANDLGDPRSLIAVSASTNRAKRARDPAEWWPPQAAYRCQYAADWVAVKARWGLSVDASERASLDARLDICTGAEFEFVVPSAADPN